MITPQTLLRHELLGLMAEVAGSTNKSLVGIRGTVIGETRGMLELETDKGARKIPKASTRFTFTLPDGVKAKVDGKLLVGQPKSRLKAKTKKW